MLLVLSSAGACDGQKHSFLLVFMHIQIDHVLHLVPVPPSRLEFSGKFLSGKRLTQFVLRDSGHGSSRFRLQ